MVSREIFQDDAIGIGKRQIIAAEKRSDEPRF
jgi:hypothetical protein